MRLIRTISAPLRAVRNLPIAVKLVATSVGSLGLLALISWIGLDHLASAGALQQSMAQRAGVERLVEQSLIAAMELVAVSRDIPQVQTSPAIKATLAVAEKARGRAADLLQQVVAVDDRTGADLSRALTSLHEIGRMVNEAGALRLEILQDRQKRLFQARPVFESTLRTVSEELAHGALQDGVSSVRDGATQSGGDRRDPASDALVAYQLSMSRLQGAALLFMATGNGSAANEVRAAVDDAKTQMAALLAADVSPAIMTDIRMLQTLGSGLATAALDLVAKSRRLDGMIQSEVAQATTELRSAIDHLVATSVERAEEAASVAARGEIEARRQMLILTGTIAVVLLAFGTVTTKIISGPMRGLTRTVRVIAAGDTAVSVGYLGWKDEVGQMAEAIEKLRGVMQQAFLQSQMIEQIPVGVMTAEPDHGNKITFMNAEARRLLDSVRDDLRVPVHAAVGAGFADLFKHDAGVSVPADPATLPRRSLLHIGGEALELTVTAIRDRTGAYAGPMLIWRCLTGQLRMASQFEDSIGGIAARVGESATLMTRTARTMSETAQDAGRRTRAVTTASHAASSHVIVAASGAEQLAASVVEIGRQVSESAQIAGTAVTQADLADRSVAGLSEAAGRIGDVIRLIGDIAAKTNLLALNATIEAARAGDAGKGFAVVAGEVKNLAAQTARATDEIAAQIGGMQTAATESADALRSITTTIQRMNDISTGIAGAVEQQGSATRDIAAAVQQASVSTGEVDGHIGIVSRAVEDTGTQSGAVLHASTSLAEQSEVLKAEVQAFLAKIREAA